MAHRILVLSASIGAGHVKAAEALCRAYTEQFGGEAYHLDFFRYSTPTFSRWVEQAYYLVTKHTPSVYKLLYTLEERPNSATKKMEVYIGVKKYRELLATYRPDAIISTHFLPAAVVSHMYKRFPIPNTVLLTDYVSHPMWIYPNAHRFFVAHSGMMDELVRFGVDSNIVRVTGIPVRPCFGQVQNQQALREKLKLAPKLPVVLIMSGGNAIGPLVEVLGALSKVSQDFQVVAIAGRNRQVYREMNRTLKALRLNGRILGYTENIHEWMAASDLLISKAGGLTVSEALTSGLPMVIIRPTPGQEDGNTVYLTEAGAGIHLKDVSMLSETVDGLLKEPEKLKAMREAALSLAKPQAVKDILQEVENVIASYVPPSPRRSRKSLRKRIGIM